MGVDVVDFTDLQRRGLLRNTTQREVVSEDTLDLTRIQAIANNKAQNESSSSDTNSAFDFLSSFAEASADNSVQTPELNKSSGHSNEIHSKLDTILNKIEDTMYKIELLSGRVAQLEARFH